MVSFKKGKQKYKAHDVWEEIFRKNYNNADEIAAEGTGSWRSTRDEIDEYETFNGLWFYNPNVACTVRIYLNGKTDNFYDIPPQNTFIINPEEGIKFSFFDYKNLSTDTAISAEELQIRVSKSVVKGKLIPIGV